MFWVCQVLLEDLGQLTEAKWDSEWISLRDLTVEFATVNSTLTWRDKSHHVTWDKPNSFWLQPNLLHFSFRFSELNFFQFFFHTPTEFGFAQDSAPEPFRKQRKKWTKSRCQGCPLIRPLISGSVTHGAPERRSKSHAS